MIRGWIKEKFCHLAGSELINRVVSHPSESVSITAHENRTIRFLDNKTGICTDSCLHKTN